MDYFVKLKKGPSRLQPSPATQLTRFHQSWELIRTILSTKDERSHLHVNQTEIPDTFRQMTDLLVDEEAREDENTTGPCMEYFLRNCLLDYLVNAAEEEDYPVGLRGETIRTVASMISWLNDRFLVHHAVHKPTVRLLRFCVFDEHQNRMYSDALVDLMYSICSKIHGYPALLHIFFYDKHWLTTPQKKKHTATLHNSNTDRSSAEPHNTKLETAATKDILESTPQHNYEFLLVTYLLRFVNREGRSGDFARTGLLFLLEMATDQLGVFILHSDLAAIVAAGLGAMYSQLPRKLIVNDDIETIHADATTYILRQHVCDINCISKGAPNDIGAECSTSTEFKHQANAFLKALEFCQDVLTRCPNKDICRSLLLNVHNVFLESVLYPSILECSDTDGSSVAVINYIDLILKTVEQEDLSNMIMTYLFDDDPQSFKITTAMELLDMKETNVEMKRNASAHFTLKDLIFSHLKSDSQATRTAALKLLKTLIMKHCTYALSLFSTQPTSNKSPITISHHLREVELYYTLISTINGQKAKQVLSQGYREYLHDIQSSIENDCCFKYSKEPLKNIDSRPTENAKSANSTLNRRRSFKYGQRRSNMTIQRKEEVMKEGAKQVLNTMVAHQISPTDPLLQILVSLFSNFFAQSTELNLALTGVISALALCPYRSLKGWISFDENDRTDTYTSNHELLKQKAIHKEVYDNGAEEEEDDDDSSVDTVTEEKLNDKTIPTFFRSQPAIFSVFHTLTQQLNAYRSEIADFDSLLIERREALLTGKISFTGNTPVHSNSTNLKRKFLIPSYNTSTTKRLNPSLIATNLKNAFLGHQDLVDSSSTFQATPPPSISVSPSTSSSSIQTINDSQKIPTVSSASYMNTILKDTSSLLSMHIKKTASTYVPRVASSQTNVEVGAAGAAEVNINPEDDEHTSASITSDLDDDNNSKCQSSLREDKEVNLSTVLNNVVILEEAIKEIVALLQVRRSSGVDAVAYT